MKIQVVVFLFVLGLVLAEETYSTENDDFDIESVVKNPAQMETFVGCFLDKSSCDMVASAFKKDIGEAIQQSCAKCTPAQKNILNRFLTVLKEKLPQEYEAFKQKFDPEDKHFKALESAIGKS